MPLSWLDRLLLTALVIVTVVVSVTVVRRAARRVYLERVVAPIDAAASR